MNAEKDEIKDKKSISNFRRESDELRAFLTNHQEVLLDSQEMCRLSITTVLGVHNVNVLYPDKS